MAYNYYSSSSTYSSSSSTSSSSYFYKKLKTIEELTEKNAYKNEIIAGTPQAQGSFKNIEWFNLP